VDRVGEWRLIDSSDAGDDESKPPSETRSDQFDRKLLVAIAMVVLAGVGAAIWLTIPQPEIGLDVAGAALSTDLDPRGQVAGSTQEPAAHILIDVQGAVTVPGLHRLPPDSRVGDAITAAGGYSAQVDIAATAAALNLAEKLVDGAKVTVPVLGQAHEIAATGDPAANGSALIDVNHATADELDTLPGIGPVTAEKIISARAEAPFATVDELLSRGVVGPSTMDKIRELIAALP
jgi:competence protein ComEA